MPAPPHLRADRRSPVVLLMALLLVAALAPLAAAQTTPNGPWVQDDQHRSLEAYTDYDQLVRELERIAASSSGRVALETIGTSNEGRDIHLAKVGSGERTILYITQQHGNEPHGTEAALRALRTLASSGQPEIRRIREELTVLMVVRANPDGSERYWRQNVDPGCDRDEATCLPGRGYDPNRWHDPRVPDADVPVPETLAVREVFRRYEPELVVDYHGQLSYSTVDGDDLVTTSLLWPIFPASVEVTEERQAAVAYSRQVTALMADSLDRYGHATVTQYPHGSTMGTARVAYGYLGAASVLLEQRADAGQKSVGMLVQQAYVTMLDVAAAVADGSVFDIDPDRADELPPRGPRVTNPHGGGGQVEACQGTGGSSARGDVRAAEGELYDAVLQYESERILPSGSQAYVTPTDEEACTMAAAFGSIVDGRYDVAAGLVAPYDYEVVLLDDPSTGRQHVLLAELASGDLVDRGWGLYVHTPGSGSDVTIEAPYPQSATFSERQAVQAFDAVHAENLLIAGAHRGANDADERATEPANVTTHEGSVFNRIHQQVTSGAGDRAVQVLGTSGDANDVVLTAGEAPPTGFAEELTGSLESSGYDVCLYGDGTCSRLASTGNVQGQWSRAVDAEWVALYPSYEIRRLLSRRAALADALAAALAD